MRESSFDRMAGAILGMADAVPHIATPLRQALNSFPSCPDLLPLAAIHPLARVAICLPFFDSDPEYARYVASEACALTHDNEIDRESVVSFLDAVAELTPAHSCHTGPLDTAPQSGLDSDLWLAWAKAWELQDFAGVYRLDTALSSVIALIAGARFGYGGIQMTLTDPRPEFWNEIRYFEFERSRHPSPAYWGK